MGTSDSRMREANKPGGAAGQVPAVDATAIRSQLERILARGPFRNSKRYPALLQLLRGNWRGCLTGAGYLSIQHLRLGRAAVIGTVDGEVYSAIGKEWKEASPMADTIMVTLADGMANSGYIPDNSSFGANTFQVLSSRSKPGCAEDTIVLGLMNLELANSK